MERVIESYEVAENEEGCVLTMENPGIALEEWNANEEETGWWEGPNLIVQLKSDRLIWKGASAWAMKCQRKKKPLWVCLNPEDDTRVSVFEVQWAMERVKS